MRRAQSTLSRAPIITAPAPASATTTVFSKSPTSPNGITTMLISLLTFLLGSRMGHWHSGAIVALSPECPCSASSQSIPHNIQQQQQQSKLPNSQGWHSIEVFYGDSNHLEQMIPPQNNQTWFSQANQDQAVIALFKGKRNGYFVDLAANDATVLSNTYSLEKTFGWTGLCIEPNPIYWANLTYRECQVVAAIVGNTRMEQVYFRFDAGDHSGILGFDNGHKFQSRSLPKYTVTLEEILIRFHTPRRIDYLSLDVEGAEDFIMQHFPLSDYHISVLTVERPNESLRALLEQHGYQFLMRLSRWGESIWAHQSVMDTLDIAALEQFHPKKRKQKQQQELQ